MIWTFQRRWLISWSTYWHSESRFIGKAWWLIFIMITWHISQDNLAMVFWMTSSGYSDFEVMDEVCKEDSCGKLFHFKEAGTQREIIVLSRLLERGLNLTYRFNFRSLKLLRVLFKKWEGSSKFIIKEHECSWLIYRDKIWFNLLQVRLRWDYKQGCKFRSCIGYSWIVFVS